MYTGHWKKMTDFPWVDCLMLFLLLLKAFSLYPHWGLGCVIQTDKASPEIGHLGFSSGLHDPGFRNCAVFISHTCINSSELHLQGVAPRSQYSDPTPEAVMLQ